MIRSIVLKALLALSDIVLINIGLILALFLRFDGKIEPQYMQRYQDNFITVTAVMLIAFLVFNLYKSLWRYASVREMLQIAGACFVGSSMLFIVGSIEKQLFPRSCYIIYIFIMTVVLIGTRFSYRLFRKVFRISNYYSERLKLRKPKQARKRVMIVGAGEAASIIIKDLNKNPYSDKHIVIAIDDDKKKQYASINGVAIKGDTSMIKQLARDYDIEEIIIAIPSASKNIISKIVKICSETRCELNIFPGIYKAIQGKSQRHIRPVKIEDLLGRDEIQLDNNRLNQVIGDKVVLITGGGGSIGSELCRQVVQFNPKKLVIFDIYENNAYDIQNELIRGGIPRNRLEVLIGSVRDKKKLHEVFEKYTPQVVFHAAAHKHVPLMEDSPEEAIKNNVFGTLNTAQCAALYKVEKFVLISTDKAVNPTNVMGATKRICEMIVQSINEMTPDTDYVAVRFGNVLGSNGSVIPLFKRQLEAGGPLTVTHPDIIRYFMTIPEAVRLILQATSFAKGGEIFVLDMGEPVKILDLAKNFIRLSGLELGKDIEIVFTGLRPGEKLYEELLMEEEGLTETVSDKIFIGKPSEISHEELVNKLNTLQNKINKGYDVREALMEVVPTYKRAEHDLKQDTKESQTSA